MPSPTYGKDVLVLVPPYLPLRTVVDYKPSVDVCAHRREHLLQNLGLHVLRDRTTTIVTYVPLLLLLLLLLEGGNLV